MLFATLFADAKIYFGAGGGGYYEAFEGTTDAKASGKMIRLKAGYGDIDAYAIEFNLEMMENDSNIFSKSDGTKYGLNVELLKAFNLKTLFNPFFKVGFGSGYMDITGTLQKNIHYGSFNLGGGVFIPLNEWLDLEICYDYKYLTYEKVDIVTLTPSYESNSNTIYSGLNVRF